MPGWHNTQPKSKAQKVSAKDNELPIMEVQNTGVGGYHAFHILKRGLSHIVPIWCNRVGGLLFCDFDWWRDTYLKVMNESGVELSKANKLCNIADSFWSRPYLQQCVFGLGWTIAINTHINATKSNSFRKIWLLHKFKDNLSA